MKLKASLGLLLALCWQTSAAEWNFTTVSGSGDVPLNVVTAGNPSNASILFIHGLGQSHYSFVHQLNSDLAEDFYLVAFDLRGHGASGKPWTTKDYGPSLVWAEDIRTVIKATKARRPLVVAWSYGANVLMDYVREFGQEAISGIVLTGSLGALTPFRLPPNNPDTEQFLRLRKLRESSDIADHIRANEGMVQWLTAAPLSDADRDLFRSFGLMLPAYARRAIMQRKLDNRDLLGTLQLPVLLSLGNRDNPIQLEDGRDLAATHSRISLSVFDGAGHSVFFEDHQRFNAELREFMTATTTGSTQP